jgi:vancomycin permeability regulator SanA
MRQNSGNGVRRRWPWQWRARWSIGALAALAVLAAVPTVWERTVAGPYLRDQANVPARPVALVFGAKVHGQRPSAFLAARLDLALGLYQQGRVRVILVSGADRGASYDEPDVMRDYLIAHGVPAEAVVADHAGFDTWDSCVRANRIFGVTEAIAVTQTFHVPRAVTLCRANGIDAYGVGADSAALSLSQTVYGNVREFAAAVKAMWQALISS